MNIEIPVLVEPDAEPEDGGVVYRVRPLFFHGPEQTDRMLASALARLAGKLEEELNVLGRTGAHRRLADWTISPDVEMHWRKLRLDLRGVMFRGNFPVVTFRQLDRTLAFSPWLDEVWFEVPVLKELDERATEIYTRWFRNAFRQRDEETVQRLLGRFEGKKKPWITFLELSVNTRAALEKKAAEGLAALDEGQVRSGDEELAAVGRCLDHLYPDGLSRAVCRDALAEELDRLLEIGDRRPILLVGPPLVGKTALIHEFVGCRAERRAANEEQVTRHEENVWLLAPQRLISGMSYVGQWENRLLAILREARSKRHILYFDDLLGLYHAGVTSKTTLTVADVMKPFVERRDVRVLAEITPEQLRLFRERDRGFADMFQIVRVEQPSEGETLSILLSVVWRLESRHGVRFGLDVLPTVLELSRCWQPEAAFPGKAAGWLNRLAVKHQGADVSRDMVLEEFRASSGLQVTFADTRARLPREDIVAGLRTRIIGQTAAIEAMADVVSVAKARLNDRQRPLGTLFFLGPTGVGKTECAKALAQYLFGDAARLVRFDMNEFVSPQSAARLAGTFHQPEGLLTGAVRRQPFCVLLLDEIEKAHPDVFDLLLQILGEARLTDALGRTASFANTVIILTSNLGTRQAARDMGFAPADSTADAVYLKAVEEFFRPEFLNRLDRIVPFRRLERGELEQIARTILADVVAREGLTRRKCAIELASDALAWIVERGYHPTLGARAMRRAVERDLVRPMARRLAAISPDTPTVLSARCGGEALAVQVTPLVEAPRRAELARPERIDDPKAILVRARLVLDRLLPAYEAHRPPMQDAQGRISPQYHWYFGVTEFLRQTRALAASLADELAAPRRGGQPPVIAPKPGRARYGISRRYLEPERHVLKELYAARDVLDYVKELAAEGGKQTIGDHEAGLRCLLERLALADALSPGETGWPAECALVLIRSIGQDDKARSRLADALQSKHGAIYPGWNDDTWRPESEVSFGLEFTHWKHHRRDDEDGVRSEDRTWWEEADGLAAYHDRYHFDMLLAEGYRAQRFLAFEEGTHLFVLEDGRIEPVQVLVVPMTPQQPVRDVLLDLLKRHEQAMEAAARGETGDDPFRWRPTISFHGPGMELLNMQVGSARDTDPMAFCPLPPEFRDLLAARGKP